VKIDMNFSTVIFVKELCLLNFIMALKPHVVCFGEILWDILPADSKPGGAPMNVAYHLNRFGISPSLISRVGNDEKGSELLRLLSSWDLSTQFCQVDDEHATSEVHTRMSANHDVFYDILAPVAWDFIYFQPEFEELMHKSDALVFGTLASRNPVSRDTLFRLIEMSRYNIFDVNLRDPYYSPELTEHLLHKTNLLKLNASELATLAGWYCKPGGSLTECAMLLQHKFSISEILLTRSSLGASYFTPSIQIDFSSYRVEVADTVGSGDAFLAGFVAKRIQHESVDTAITYAGALGALVTMHPGACPQYTLDDLEDFKGVKEIKRIYH
jgi:fructokinase